MNIYTYYAAIYAGRVPDIFDELVPESEEYIAVKKLVDNVKSLLLDDDKLALSEEQLKNYKERSRYSIFLEATINMISIMKYIKWMEHPIYLSAFNNKNGKVYLQAKTANKDKTGKTKWISAYVGTLNDYPKGVSDPDAIKKGKSIIRQKIKKYFI
jgi:hypothetical protein